MGYSRVWSPVWSPDSEGAGYGSTDFQNRGYGLECFKNFEFKDDIKCVLQPTPSPRAQKFLVFWITQ